MKLCNVFDRVINRDDVELLQFDGQNMAETIRRLKNELLMSNEKVNRLTTHIICNVSPQAIPQFSTYKFLIFRVWLPRVYADK